MSSPATGDLPTLVERQDASDIDLLRGLVAIESLSGSEQGAVRYLVEEMTRRGFDAHVDAAGSAVGRIGAGDRHVVLLGHIDTVPGRIPVRTEDGVLHGRGSVDAKGPLAAFVAAAARAADRLGSRVSVVGAVGEESMGSPGAHQIATWDPPDCCIIGEPSGWDAVCLGYRGSLTLGYRLTQGSRHTAGPGRSAAEQAIAFWNVLTAEIAALNAATTGEFSRIAPTVRAFNTTADGLAEVATLDLGFRLPPGVDVEELIQTVRRLAGDAVISVVGFQHGYRSDKRSALSPPFLRAIRAEGGTPRFNVKLGTSDMNVVGPVWGCPIVAYGPGDAALDHTPDEHIVLDEYLRGIRILTSVLVSL